MLQQVIRVGSIILLASACISAMEQSAPKQIITTLATPHAGYYVKVLDSLQSKLGISFVQHSVVTTTPKSTLPIALLSYKLYQQQQNNTSQHRVRLLLANDQEIQLTPELSSELVQASATIQNLIQNLEEQSQEIPLPLLTQEQVITLLSYISSINALNTSDSTLPIVQQEMPETATISSYYLKYTALQQLKEHLTTCTVTMLCDLIIAASYLAIQNSEQSINFIELVTQALGNKLLQSLQYQDEYDVIHHTLPPDTKHMLVRYLIDNSAIRYTLCSNSTDVIASTAQTLPSHADWINSVVWSPNGKYIASGSNDCTIKIWDATTGACIHTLTGHDNRITSVSWSPDGKQLASSSDDCTIKIWDATTGACIHTLTSETSWITSVSWSPDGKHIASGSWDNTIKIWDATTGTCTQTLTGHTNGVDSVSWSPDGKHIASSSDDRTIKIWNVSTGTCIHTLTGHSKRINSVVWSPDGKHIASSSDDRTIKIWDTTTTGDCIHTLTGHTHRVRSIAWSPDGKHIASGGDDNTVRVWNIIDTERDNYLKNNLSWQQALLLVRIINAHDNQQDIDFTHDAKALHYYKSLDQQTKQLVEPLLSEVTRTTLLTIKNLERLIRSNPVRAALFGVGIETCLRHCLKK